MFDSDDGIEIGKDGFDTTKDGKSLDLLRRKAFGKELSALVEKLTLPTVIALDAPWGSGKSHFLKLWCGAHVNENDGKARPIYFDAFAADYLDDPLLSLISALKRDEQFLNQNTLLDTLERAVVPLSRTALRAALAVVTSGATEAIGAIGKAAFNAVAAETDKAIDAIWKQEDARAAAMSDFKVALKDLGNGKPIVFVIDELDRCRPDYALAMLEVTKHFFAVPNVHFILGVHLEALEAMVAKRYGQTNAALYLQKFYHFPLAIPASENSEPQWMNIFEDLKSRLDIDSRAHEMASNMMPRLTNISVSIRDAQRVAVRLSLLSGYFKDRRPLGLEYIMVFATLLQVFHPQKYKKFRNHQAYYEEIHNLFDFISDIQSNNNEIDHDKIWRFLGSHADIQGIDRGIPTIFGTDVFTAEDAWKRIHRTLHDHFDHVTPLPTA